MSTKALIAVLVAGSVGIVVFLFVHLSNAPGGSIEIGASHAEACVKNKTGDCLPDVTYTDLDGHKYTPASLAGKVVVVNFWATWCHPCQMEIPDLSKVYSRYKDKGVVFLGIMSDNPSPSNAEVRSFRSDHGMTYPVVRVDSDILVSYNYPQALPTTFVFNRDGKRVYRHVGPMTADALSELLDQYVAEKR